jgi:NAD(P)H-hydrate epimerase
MKIVSSLQMRELDKLTVKSGVPGEVLMERAGTGAGEYILDFISCLHPAHVKRFIVLAGKGNNGGDAYVVARFLSQNSRIPVKALSICHMDELAGDAKLNAEKLPGNVSCEFRRDLKTRDFQPGDMIIDGLLGTGISGMLRAPYGNWIEMVNSRNLPVVSLDIPSGLNGDDGSVAGFALKADLTITIGLPKKGMISGNGPSLCGRIRCVDIGVPSDLIEKIGSGMEMIFDSDVRKFLGRLDVNSHKGENGHVLVVGGSRKYNGAPFLSAEAALRTGAGLATVAIPENIQPVQRMLSLIVRKIPDEGTGYFSTSSVPELIKLVEKSDSIVMGPGIGDEPSVKKMMLALCSFGKPAVFDADALNVISRLPDILLKREYPSVLTPHPGEMKRLLKGFDLAHLMEAERPAQALGLAEKTGSVVVLKGNRTVIAAKGKPLSINGSGSPALATAGTGDVLSGMIGSFMAQGLTPFDASVCAVFIHGLAGENGKFGMRGLTADDLIGLIPETMKRISPFA